MTKNSKFTQNLKINSKLTKKLENELEIDKKLENFESIFESFVSFEFIFEFFVISSFLSMVDEVTIRIILKGCTLRDLLFCGKFLKLHMALVSCQNLHLSLNDSILKKVTKKLRFVAEQ